jgi:agmatinase
MDLRDEYDGNPLSHATGSRHMASHGPTCVLGVRSGARDEWHDAEKLLTAFGEPLEIPLAFQREMRDHPVFVSLDLDVLDPSILPGTGTPEPGGPTYKELRAALLALSGARIVGFDLVEVATDRYERAVADRRRRAAARLRPRLARVTAPGSDVPEQPHEI